LGSYRGVHSKSLRVPGLPESSTFLVLRKTPGDFDFFSNSPTFPTRPSLV
jgi:hypothetical protein